MDGGRGASGTGVTNISSPNVSQSRRGTTMERAASIRNFPLFFSSWRAVLRAVLRVGWVSQLSN
jgi:hypothetical protein